MKVITTAYLGLMMLMGCALAESRYELTLVMNDAPVLWQAEGVGVVDGVLTVADITEPLVVYFDGGQLELNLLDYGTFDEAHVVAVSFRRGESSYTFSATVRHHDEGWDHYADAFEVVGEQVSNGLRVLLHPHENEQPFTRSQSGVQAAGWVTIRAHDNVHEYGGSTISLDLEHPVIDQEQLSLRYTLELLE